MPVHRDDLAREDELLVRTGPLDLPELRDRIQSLNPPRPGGREVGSLRREDLGEARSPGHTPYPLVVCNPPVHHVAVHSSVCPGACRG